MGKDTREERLKRKKYNKYDFKVNHISYCYT